MHRRSAISGSGRLDRLLSARKLRWSHSISSSALILGAVRAEKLSGDGLALSRHPVLERLRGCRLAAARPTRASELVSRDRPADAAADRRRSSSSRGARPGAAASGCSGRRSRSGLAMSALGLTGWAAEELMLGHGTWLAWPAVFALFGSVAPLFALLAQPHRGIRANRSPRPPPSTSPASPSSPGSSIPSSSRRRRPRRC